MAKNDKEKMTDAAIERARVNAVYRKLNENWKRVENSGRYQRANVKDAALKTSRGIEQELLDGIFLNLNERSQEKSYKVQGRILRRIVEKRHAQATHKVYGRHDDLDSRYLIALCTRDCMKRIDRRRHAA